ncbi:hypothetical protein GBA63_22280 (plasmid) [Rubrobacter tropicus]|uniref:Uncharacterized protein n=1 Tax=Rubrobacter tropicus TaxID=2653851 RepID=A0A6G8QG98_9ACTN|nr:hypothetical protein [Rubrobacter tropicus]QIN85431.1 hypothetical protein GBA63_22280 [Rubrobacter tropicus]
MDRWDGPFDANVVRGFLAHMREGANVELFRDRAGPEGISREAEPLGWLQKRAPGRFVGQTLSGNVLAEGALPLDRAVAAFLELEPGWVLHNVAYRPKVFFRRAADVTDGLRAAVREVIADKGSAGDRRLERMKVEHWNDRLLDWGLAGAALVSLGHPDHTEEVQRELAPDAREAFEAFKQARPDLEPW